MELLEQVPQEDILRDGRKYPQKDIKILYGKAAARCAIRSCRIYLVLDREKGLENKQIGKIAHIIAHSSRGPRADPQYPKDKIDSYENWILLCPTCHDVVDAKADEYSIDELRKIKATHESWVANQLDDNMLAVTFAELEIAAKAIATGKYCLDNDFSVVKPEVKIKRNDLTEEIRALISTGLSRSPEVSKYLVNATQLDSRFPERLKYGFKEKYIKLKKDMSGDALFMAMFEFAKQGSQDFKQQAASLAILTHLFHLCEIFEK